MAEYSEVMRQLNRLCSHYKNCSESGCPMFDECGNIGAYCSGPKQSYRIEKIVMAWAAEHPEPVYPTFAEWLNSIGVAISDRPFRAPNIPVYLFQVNAKMFEPIPADIAQKLGIEPKEI